MIKQRAIPSRCDVCGGRLRAQYFRVFNRVSCSDVCTAVLYDREYDLPSGATLNEMLYRRLQNKSKGVTVKTYRPVRRDRGGHLWLAGLFILGIVLWLLLASCAPRPRSISALRSMAARDSCPRPPTRRPSASSWTARSSPAA